jgi:hypothetical protein
MPGDYHYLDESNVVVSTYWGTITLVDILETITHRVHDLPDHHPKASVIDLSAAQWAETPPRFMKEEMERLRPALAPPKVRTVFIASGDFFYGFARMYSIVHNIYGAANVDVVRSWEAAGKLLGIELSTAEKWSHDRAAQEENTRETTRFPKP